jgi:hypothetical protein
MKSLGPDCPTRSPLGALGSDATTCIGLHRNASSIAAASAASRAVAPAESDSRGFLVQEKQWVARLSGGYAICWSTSASGTKEGARRIQGVVASLLQDSHNLCGAARATQGEHPRCSGVRHQCPRRATDRGDSLNGFCKTLCVLPPTSRREPRTASRSIPSSPRIVGFSFLARHRPTTTQKAARSLNELFSAQFSQLRLGTSTT